MFRNTIRLSTSLDPDQAQLFVRPDLGPNCLQRSAADDKICCVSDDFHTPMSTPPSEAMDEDTGEQTMNITDLSQLDLSESQFYDKLYDRYVINHCPN